MAHLVLPQHIYTGKNALGQAAETLAACGRRALIVTGRHVGKSPMYEKLTAVCKQYAVEYRTFDGVVQEPTDRMIEEGVALYRREGCDFVIGIGGGSPLDSAKAIAAMTVNPGKIADYNGKEITGAVPKIVAIPTTAGTGSEATRFTVITDTERDVKMLLKGDCLVPFAAIVDPDFSMDMPKSVTAATGLDALTHAVEAYTSKKANAFTDALALSAVKRIMRELPVVFSNGYDARARGEMAVAALLAGICINHSSVTIVHGMSRPIGALFHVPHGLSNAMLLPECIGFALDGAYGRFADLGRAAGAAGLSDSDQEAAEKFKDALAKLCRICEVPTPAQYGISREAFERAIDKMAEDAIASGSPSNTIKNVEKEDCIALYKKLYA